MYLPSPRGLRKGTRTVRCTLPPGDQWVSFISGPTRALTAVITSTISAVLRPGLIFDMGFYWVPNTTNWNVALGNNIVGASVGAGAYAGWRKRYRKHNTVDGGFRQHYRVGRMRTPITRKTALPHGPGWAGPVSSRAGLRDQRVLASRLNLGRHHHWSATCIPFGAVGQARTGNRVFDQYRHPSPKDRLQRCACKGYFVPVAEDKVPKPVSAFGPDQVVVPDTAILQGLAHPLRLRLLGLLRLHGPSTATKLAVQCGESSGLTSYHLRQLASAGLIVEAGPEDLEGISRVGGRERWWKAAHQFTSIEPPPVGDAAAEAASMEFWQAVLATIAGQARAWLSAAAAWPRAWRELTDFSNVPLRLTLEEARELVLEIAALVARYRHHDPAQKAGNGVVPADAVIVSMQYQVFPHPDQEPPAAGEPR